MSTLDQIDLFNKYVYNSNTIMPKKMLKDLHRAHSSAHPHSAVSHICMKTHGHVHHQLLPIIALLNDATTVWKQVDMLTWASPFGPGVTVQQPLVPPLLHYYAVMTLSPCCFKMRQQISRQLKRHLKSRWDTRRTISLHQGKPLHTTHKSDTANPKITGVNRLKTADHCQLWPWRFVRHHAAM